MVTRYHELSEPFPRSFVETVKKGSRSEDYVNHAVVTDRLNRTVAYTFEVREVYTYRDEAGRNHVDGVLVRLRIGDEYRDEGGGPERASNFGDELKNAISDAVKRAGMRFGVAIQLWHELPEGTTDPDWGARPAQDAGPSGGTEAVQPARASAAPVPEPSEPGVSADPTDSGEGSEGTKGTSGSDYLSKEEQKAFAKALGGQTAALGAARDKYGERIRSLGDLTRDMALEMVGERVA